MCLVIAGRNPQERARRALLRLPPGQKDETYAFTLMLQEKYRNITVLEDGYAAWVKRGYPVEAVSR